MDPRAYGPDGHAERARDLLVGLVGDVTEDDGDTEVLRDRRQRGLHLVGERLAGFVGSGRGGQDPLLVVSPWFEVRRERYHDELLALVRGGDWDRWISFFAAGVGASAVSTRERVDALLAWREQALEKVRAAGISGIAERVAGELIGAPTVRAGQVAARHGITHQGAIRALRRLADLHIVSERARNGRVAFTATAVVELLSR